MSFALRRAFGLLILKVLEISFDELAFDGELDLLVLNIAVMFLFAGLEGEDFEGEKKLVPSKIRNVNFFEFYIY